MGCRCWNPERKVRRNQPHALAGMNFHDAANRVNQLIRSVRMLGNLKSSLVFVRQSRDRDAGLRIISANNFGVSQ